MGEGHNFGDGGYHHNENGHPQTQWENYQDSLLECLLQNSLSHHFRIISKNTISNFSTATDRESYNAYPSWGH